MKPSSMLDGKADQIKALTIKHKAQNPRVFGSVLKGTDNSSSDIDILVDVLPETTLFDLGGLQAELEILLGVRVDLLTPGDLPQHMLDIVLIEARPL